jgi:hypothetical protein
MKFKKVDLREVTSGKVVTSGWRKCGEGRDRESWINGH